MILEDGVSTGDLSSQSGDHGVTTDPNGLERIEVVRGPATLLYGSNAVGGVVNAITPHESFRHSRVAGTRGQFNADGGSANNQAGTSASVQHGRGNLTIWASGGARRTDDYNTPEGVVENSATQLSHGRAGVGYFGERLYASGGVTLENGRNGVPFADEVDGSEEGAVPLADDLQIGIDSRRRVGRFDVGMRNLTTGAADAFRVIFTSIDWEHDEIETVQEVESVGTAFDNRIYVVRAEVDQRRRGALSGTFGVWTKFRDYITEGEEALTPQTDQAAFAVFGYEEFDLGRYRIQLGGRVERNAYAVSKRQEAEGPPDLAPPNVRDRTFTGLSASAGIQADLGESDTLVANLTRSYRAPALEELYNFGPHVGTCSSRSAGGCGSDTRCGFSSLTLSSAIIRPPGRQNPSLRATSGSPGPRGYLISPLASLGGVRVCFLQNRNFLGKEALQRLQTMLTDTPLPTGERTRWGTLERSPFADSAQSSVDHNTGSDSANDDGLTDFRREDQVEQLEQTAAERELSNEESLVEETTNVTDIRSAVADDSGQADQRAGVAAFQAAIGEAQRNAESQLRAALDRVKREEAKRHAAEITRVREELERQHADDLECARSAALDSINALTGSILGSA